MSGDRRPVRRVGGAVRDRVRDRVLLARLELTGDQAVARDRLLDRLVSLDPLLELAQGVLEADPSARAALRARLLAAAPEGGVARLAAAMAAGREAGAPPAGEGAIPSGEATLVAAAVQVADDAAEALAFAALAMGGVEDLQAEHELRTTVRRGGPGGVVLPPADVGGPLRPPGGLEVPEIVPAGGIRWEDPERRRLPPVVFRGRECLEVLTGLVGAASLMAPRYRIRSISPDDACAGAVVELVGEGFGSTPGGVAFPHVAGGVVMQPSVTWEDGRIVVRVPADAVGGVVGLAIEIRQVSRCGTRVVVWRRGDDVTFHGGQPQVRSCRFETVGADAAGVGLVDVGVPVVLRWDTLPPARPGSDRGDVTVVVTSAGAELARLTGLPGGQGVHALDLGGVGDIRDVTAEISVTTPCGGPARAGARARTTRSAGLRIEAVELTQGVQADPATTDPWTTHVADRATTARVYARVRPDFDWGHGPGVCPVTARVGLGRTDVGAALVVRQETDPSLVESSLNLRVPSSAVTAGDQLGVRITIATDPTRAPVPAQSATASSAVQVDRARSGRRVVLLRVGHPALGLPPPTLQDFFDTWAAAYARLPLGVTQWRWQMLPGAQTWSVPDSLRLTGSGDATTDAARKDEDWSDLLDQVRDVGLSADLDDRDLVVGLLPRLPAYLLNGRALMEGDVRTLLCQSGLGATLAHELAHSLALEHSPHPPDIEGGVPGRPTRTAHAGWDDHRRRPVPREMWDLMTYGDPASDGGPWPGGLAYDYQDRWPSQTTWDLLKGRA